MTVIVYSKGILATDGRISIGNLIENDNYNKITEFPTTKKHAVYYKGDQLLAMGVSGSIKDIEVLLSAMVDGRFEGEDLKEKNWWEVRLKTELHTIIVGKKYAYSMYQDGKGMIKYDKSFTLTDGSGFKYAKAGIEAGLGTVEAVKLAIKMDSSCGGTVFTYEDKYYEK